MLRSPAWPTASRLPPCQFDFVSSFVSSCLCIWCICIWWSQKEREPRVDRENLITSSTDLIDKIVRFPLLFVLQFTLERPQKIKFQCSYSNLFYSLSKLLDLSCNCQNLIDFLQYFNCLELIHSTVLLFYSGNFRTFQIQMIF